MSSLWNWNLVHGLWQIYCKMCGPCHDSDFAVSFIITSQRAYWISGKTLRVSSSSTKIVHFEAILHLLKNMTASQRGSINFPCFTSLNAKSRGVFFIYVETAMLCKWIMVIILESKVEHYSIWFLMLKKQLSYFNWIGDYKMTFRWAIVVVYIMLLQRLMGSLFFFFFLKYLK